MQFDRKSVDRMLNMEDDSLRQLIAGLARDAGIDPAALKIGPADLAALRRAFGAMSDEELHRLAGQLGQNGGKNHGQ